MDEPGTPLSRRVLAEIERYEAMRSERRRRRLRNAALVAGCALAAAVLREPLSSLSNPADRRLDAVVATLESGSGEARANAYSDLAARFAADRDPAVATRLLAGARDEDPRVRSHVLRLLVATLPGASEQLPQALVALEQARGVPLEIEVASTGDVALLLQNLEALTVAEEMFAVLWLIESMGPEAGAPYADFVAGSMAFPSALVRGQALRTLVAVAPTSPVLPDLVEAALAGAADEKIAGLQVVEGLALTGFLAPVRALLADPDAVVRDHAAYTLVGMADPQAELALAPLLADPDALVQIHAAYFLGRLGDADAIERLVAWAAGNLTDGSSRSDATAEALLKLNRLGDPRAPQVAVQHLTGFASGVGRAQVVRVALDVLAKQPTPDAEQVLLPLLAASDPIVAVDAAVVLVRLGSGAGVAALNGWIQGIGVSESVQQYAIRASGRLGESQFLPALEIIHEGQDEQEETREEAGRAIDTIGGDGG